MPLANHQFVKKFTNLNNYLLFLSTPISLLILFFILIVRPFFLIRVGQLISDRFGHFIGNTEIYLSEKKLKINLPQKKHLDIFFCSSRTSNRFLKIIIKRSIITLPYFFMFFASSSFNSGRICSSMEFMLTLYFTS